MNKPDKLHRIKGGNFTEPWNVEKLQEKIDKLPQKTKKRILFVGEASFLKTGFSTYWDAIIRRLHETNKYEIAEMGCILDPRALISMEKGKLTPISMVNVGDKVLTHKGQIKNVTHTFKTMKKTQAVKILRKNLSGKTIEVTHNHPILAIKKEDAYKYISPRTFNNVNDINYKWIPAGELRQGDLVAYGKENFQSKSINTIESEGIKIPLNNQSAFLFGSFLANGCIIKNKKLGINAISFCGNKNHKKIAIQTANAISSLFNINTPKIFYREEMGVWEIKICNRGIARFFYTLFGTSCHDKFISDKFWNAPQDWIIKLLSSYFEQDGCINTNRNVVVAKTVSELLSNRIMQLGQKHGIFINRKWCQNNENTLNGYYLLECRGQYGNILIKNFVEKTGKLKKLGPVEYIEKDNFIFTKIAQIQKRNFNDYVYNLEIEDDNSYICNNFVVHNSYAKTSDPRAQSLPWKFYGVIPEDNDSAGIQAYKQNYREAQFGRLVMDNVLADCKANIICTCTDWWMAYFWADSAFRDRFHWVYMACVDSYPQKWEWINTYGNVDTLLAYSHFGKRSLEEQSRTQIAQSMHLKPLDVEMVTQPGIDTEVYKPVDKKAVKEQFGIPSEFRFIGMASRNQKRKLFPRLIESFRMFKDRNGWGDPNPTHKKIKDIDNIKLLLHTCVKDVGFDIPETIRREGLQNEVLFSYICTKCGACAVSMFAGHPAKCPKCGEMAMITPNTQFGYPDEQFAKLFNLFDVYVQASIAGACLPAGEKIITTNGYKNIETIAKGEKVLTSENKFETVIETNNRQYTGDIVSIKPYFINIPTKVSSDHKVLAIDKQKHNIKHITECDNKQAEWVNAEKIDKNKHILLYPCNSQVFNPTNKIDITDYIDKDNYEVTETKIIVHGCNQFGDTGQHCISPKINRFIDITPEELNKVHKDNNYLYLQINNIDKEYVENTTIYNIDVENHPSYVSSFIVHNSEMTIINSKAVGVPTIVTNYAAMAEQGKNGGGALIKCDLETEAETMQWRAWFNRQALVDKLTKIMKKPKILERLSNEARRCAVNYYDWDLTAKKWEYILDKIEINEKAWDKKAERLDVPEEKLHKQELSNENFVDKCYKEILHREPDEEGRKNWLDKLKKGADRNKIEKYFRDITEKNNKAADLLNNTKSTNPIETIAKSMDTNDTFRILYCMPETAGDVLISTAIIEKLQDEYPDASIYFATKPQYFDIIKDHPWVHGVVEYHPELLNYRTPEHFGPSPGFVDMCFCPFIITQKLPHWIHGGNGESLGVNYAHMCNLTMTNEEIEEEMLIDIDGSIDIPENKYITFHSKTTQDPKDYERWGEVIPNIKELTIVQVGAKDDPLIKHDNIVDMRGKTTPQQLAHLIANAELHLGLDSFPAHIARAVGTKSVVLYGGTYAKQGGIINGVSLEPENRGKCITSCHLEKCILKDKKVGDKCINNIVPEKVLETLKAQLGEKHIIPPKPLKLSAYCIIKDGEKYRFPYEKCINEACKVVDEFVMVDGGSTDNTWENLQKIAKDNNKLKIMQHPWDMNNPMLMGDEKTYARKQCTGDYLIQLDADEILREPQEGQIRNLVKMNRNIPIFNFPSINLFKDQKTLRVERPFEKWRISKNDENIVHGVHGEAREFDPNSMRVIYDKKVSDSCLPPGELIYTKERGLVPVECIKKGEHVLGHSGNFKKVIATGSRQYSGDMYEIQARGFGNKLKLTSNHKVLSKRWGVNNWVEASDLYKNDLLTFIMPNACVSNEHVYDLAKFEDFSNNKYWKITDEHIVSKCHNMQYNRYIKLNKSVAWLLGIYAAEGSKCMHQVRFSLHLKEECLVNKIKEKITEVFGIIHFTDYKKPHDNGRDIIAGSKGVGAFFKFLVGDRSYNKRVPFDILINKNKDILSAFLQGYMDGDGSYNKNKEVFETNTTSKTLAYELFIIMSKIGHNANVRLNRNAHKAKMPNGKIYTCKPIYRVYYFDKSRPKAQQYIVYSHKDYLESTIRTIKKEKYNGIVFNIQVEDDSSYMTSAFHVKNCEYIDKNTLKIMPNASTTPPQALQLHAAVIKMEEEGKKIPQKLIEEYSNMIKQVIEKMPHTLHLSWNDTDVKQNRGEFWDQTWHAKNSWTHNSSNDIKERLEKSEDLFVTFDENDPFNLNKE